MDPGQSKTERDSQAPECEPRRREDTLRKSGHEKLSESARRLPKSQALAGQSRLDEDELLPWRGKNGILVRPYALIYEPERNGRRTLKGVTVIQELQQKSRHYHL